MKMKIACDVLPVAMFLPKLFGHPQQAKTWAKSLKPKATRLEACVHNLSRGGGSIRRKRRLLLKRAPLALKVVCALPVYTTLLK